jgi:two-component system cell cycle response regulator
MRARVNHMRIAPDVMHMNDSAPGRSARRRIRDVLDTELDDADLPLSSRVLLAEDDLVSRKRLERTLVSWGYDVTVAVDGHDAWAKLQGPHAPSLAVIDWEMPGIDGLELCRRVRGLVDRPYVYVLMVTGRTAKDDLVAGMEAGADDYLTKPFDMHELEMRLRAGRRILDLQAELVRARESLRRQALTDLVTGLRNRRAILDLLDKEMQRAARHRAPVGVIVVDLDHFKVANDTYGHIFGDEVLRTCADRMRAVIRSYDAVGRLGGEEFLVVLGECTPDIVVAVAERMRRAVAAAPIPATGTYVQTASFGAAVAPAGSCSSPESLVHAADAAMYRAKEAGRNRVEFAQPSDHVDMAPVAI